VPSLQTSHFRFPGAPSPVIDECTSAPSFAASRSRGDLANAPHVRFPPGSSSPISASSNAPAVVVLPSTYSQVVGFLPAWDVERLETVYSRLRTCGFYYGRMPIDEATERLKQSTVGTFLLRDSSDERYLFSISVQTCRGTTSIRDCVLRLVAYYVGLCRRSSSSNASKTSSTVTAASQPTGSSYVLLEASGRRDTPVLLRAPLRNCVPPLGHLCRRTIHGALNRGGSQSWLTSSEVERSSLVDRLHLIPSLKRYLKDYPYDL
jgi:SOCS box/SH2 domain